MSVAWWAPCGGGLYPPCAMLEALLLGLRITPNFLFPGGFPPVLLFFLFLFWPPIWSSQARDQIQATAAAQIFNPLS